MQDLNDLGGRRSLASRRRFVQGLALAGGVSAIGFRPSQAQAIAGLSQTGVLSGDRFGLVVEERAINITGRGRSAMTVNGSVPGPTLRFRQGDVVTIDVTNRLKEPTSIHWHGLRLPAEMDGVPGLSFAGIMPGETFAYRFPITQSGTYWYHSHSGMQEQVGQYGALVLAPAGAEAHPFDREHVILLSDWTDEDPMTVVANLKQQGDYYNYSRPTLADLNDDARARGLGAALKDWTMWGRMRMSPTDILDVTGATYTYLVNGQPPAANWTGLFSPGEKVRLRVINGSSMTIFDVRIAGLKMTVVQADGCDIEPVEVDEFRIGTAETYDVIVEPQDAAAYTLFAQAMDRSGYARATLAPRPGMIAAVPPMDPRPRLTMADMGMGDMAGMDMTGQAAPGGMAAMPGMGGDAPKPAAPGAPMDMSHMDMAGMDMSKMNMPGMSPAPAAGATLPSTDASGVDPKTLKGKVNVDNVAAAPSQGLDKPGLGLDGNGRRVLVYADLKALTAADPRAPSREITFHLTGNMQRWTWGFDGKKFSEAPPVRLVLGERVRFALINDTMMAHPIHLHGLFSELENGQGDRQPLKHTVLVQPGQKLSYLVSADTPGRWAFHCHLLFHMETGMFRTVLVA
jgi:CopA family copper-resistance protein